MATVRLSRRSTLIVAAALAAAVLAGVGVIIWCANRDQAGATAPIEAVLQQNESRLMAMDGVVGVGIGEKDGQPVIQLYTDPSATVSSGGGEPSYPGSLGGYDVVVEPAGPITAQPEPSGVTPGSGGTTGTTEPPATTTPPTGDTTWTMDGSVTAVSADAQGTPIGFLVEDPNPQAGGYDKAWLRVVRDTRFVDADGNAVAVPSAATLKGKHVKVRITGPVAESYPVQATAGEVMLL